MEKPEVKQVEADEGEAIKDLTEIVPAGESPELKNARISDEIKTTEKIGAVRDTLKKTDEKQPFNFLEYMQEIMKQPELRESVVLDRFLRKNFASREDYEKILLQVADEYKSGGNIDKAFGCYEIMLRFYEEIKDENKIRKMGIKLGEREDEVAKSYNRFWGSKRKEVSSEKERLEKQFAHFAKASDFFIRACEKDSPLNILSKYQKGVNLSKKCLAMAEDLFEIYTKDGDTEKANRTGRYIAHHPEAIKHAFKQI